MVKILVADSNPRNSELISQLLTQTGYQVITADNGKQVLAKAQLFAPDLAVIDTDFHDISGFEVCKRIKTDSATKYTLILFICSLETKDSKIKAFQAGADDIIEKTFDSRVLIAKVSSLLRISELRDELELKYKELEDKDKMLDFQLKMSRQIQRSIMRDIDIRINGIHILTHYLPALDIGGDFYDFLRLSDSKFGLCIGDVSGHGISAALLTTMLSIMIRNVSDKYYNPEQLLDKVNYQFCDIFDGTGIEIYATLFCAIVDTDMDRIYFSNAGQPFPFFLKAKNSEVTELCASGTPIGLIKESVYEHHVVEYNKGDMLVLFTDGLSDAFYKDSPEEFTSRMKELLADSYSFPDISAVQDSIINEFYELNADESKKFIKDDVSLIICRFEE